MHEVTPIARKNELKCPQGISEVYQEAKQLKTQMKKVVRPLSSKSSDSCNCLVVRDRKFQGYGKSTVIADCIVNLPRLHNTLWVTCANVKREYVTMAQWITLQAQFISVKNNLIVIMHREIMIQFKNLGIIPNIEHQQYNEYGYGFK